MIGTTLAGHYQIVKSLSSGGFGETYIAEDTHRPGNPQCVLKHLKPANSSPQGLQIARRLFNSEAQVLEKLGEHPQIPRLFAYFEENEEFYLVQEFIEGHPLSAELPLGQRWSETQVTSMLEDVLGILEFVHTQGVIHRDIKPDNIMRRESDNKLVLIDFGAIKEVENQGIPQTGQVSGTVAIGTPGYMPTEQGRGKPRPNSDLYALGMIAIQALTGMLPNQLREDDETGEISWQNQAEVSPALAV
ncbi:MAG: protein kinase domain-containing protein, partial [Planktothrix sp.]